MTVRAHCAVGIAHTQKIVEVGLMRVVTGTAFHFLVKQPEAAKETAVRVSGIIQTCGIKRIIVNEGDRMVIGKVTGNIDALLDIQVGAAADRINPACKGNGNSNTVIKDRGHGRYAVMAAQAEKAVSGRLSCWCKMYRSGIVVHGECFTDISRPVPKRHPVGTAINIDAADSTMRCMAEDADLIHVGAHKTAIAAAAGKHGKIMRTILNTGYT